MPRNLFHLLKWFIINHTIQNYNAKNKRILSKNIILFKNSLNYTLNKLETELALIQEDE
jgi:hypothetical protein